MKNLWSDTEAKKIVKSNSKKGISKELALRVYTSRLLGNNKKLVMHGGGNTSVKCKAKDYFGNSIDVLNIKGCLLYTSPSPRDS